MADEEGIIDPVSGAEIPRPERVDTPTEEPDEKDQVHEPEEEEDRGAK